MKTTKEIEGEEVVIRVAEKITYSETGDTFEVGEEIARHSIEPIRYTGK